MPSFDLEFYLASDMKKIINEESFTCTLGDIDTFGELYSENLLLKLDKHYQLYQSKINPLWFLGNSGTFSTISKVETMNLKNRLPGVSGNIGEAIIIPVLSGIINRKIKYHRITATKKCPDYRIECIESFMGLWGEYNSYYPLDIPLEVKTRYDRDENYPIKALNQLISYWEMTNEDGNTSYVGYGIIARVNLDLNGGTIRFILFRPKKNFSLSDLKKSIENSIKKSTKESTTQETENNDIHKNVGGFFV